jgi:hypothetical protein
MSKYRVNYTITGTYTVDSSDVLGDESLSEAEEQEQMEEAINEDPFADVDPINDGAVKVEVVKE